MAKFAVSYSEVYRKTYIVEAESWADAEEKLREVAEDSGLDASDCFDHWDTEPSDTFGCKPIPENADLRCFDILETRTTEEISGVEKDKSLNYIISFVSSSGWEDFNCKEQIRALFTTYCLAFGIDADSLECDNTLLRIYREANMESLVEYGDFEQYMIELIV